MVHYKNLMFSFIAFIGLALLLFFLMFGMEHMNITNIRDMFFCCVGSFFIATCALFYKGNFKDSVNDFSTYRNLVLLSLLPVFFIYMFIYLNYGV